MSIVAMTAPRSRRTKARVAQLELQILEEIAADHPQSVRHLFYRMTDPRLAEPVEKSERGYVTVQRKTVELRRRGALPYGWITDATRRGYFADTWSSPADAIEHVAQLYRRSYWPTAPVYVEAWCESRSIAGVIEDECRHYAVPLYPAGGFTSLSLAWQCAEHIASSAAGRPVHVLYLGDFDPAGVLIDKKIEAELRRHLPGFELHLHRLAVTAEQIVLMGLPTKPGKPGDRRGGFTGGTVEAEAVPAGTMRTILREAIEQFIDPRALAVLETAEESERQSLMFWAQQIARIEARS